MTWTVTTDLARIDLDLVHRWLSTEAYWALGRSRETVQRAAEHSLNLGVLDEDGTLCGYARLVTDHATFGWLCDVIVPSERRGQGIGKQIARAVAETAERLQLKRVMLFTGDAHGLYQQVGFEALADPSIAMILGAQSRRSSAATAPASSASPLASQASQE